MFPLKTSTVDFTIHMYCTNSSIFKPSMKTINSVCVTNEQMRTRFETCNRAKAR